jgi:hypothetical protein
MNPKRSRGLACSDLLGQKRDKFINCLRNHFAWLVLPILCCQAAESGGQTLKPLVATEVSAHFFNPVAEVWKSGIIRNNGVIHHVAQNISASVWSRDSDLPPLQETTKVRSSSLLVAATGPKASDDRTHSATTEEADNYCSLTVWHFVLWVFWGALGGACGSLITLRIKYGSFWPNVKS